VRVRREGTLAHYCAAGGHVRYPADRPTLRHDTATTPHRHGH
jgi:hypothetical protein